MILTCRNLAPVTDEPTVFCGERPRPQQAAGGASIVSGRKSGFAKTRGVTPTRPPPCFYWRDGHPPSFERSTMTFSPQYPAGPTTAQTDRAKAASDDR